jgi:pSer/pThr/pTyr-binding forkhead associated (FHA) protein
MLAHLVPCSGGKPIALTKPKLYLGRREGTDAAAPLSSQTARCRLHLQGRWWVIDKIDPSIDLKINNRLCETSRIRPGDELAIGRSRFRIEYDSPESDSEFAMQVLSDTAPLPTPESDDSSLSTIITPPPVPIPSRAPLLTPRKPQAPALLAPSSGTMNGILAHLVPVGGGQDYSITKPEVIVGRESSCDVAIRMKTVSSVHCKLKLIDGYWRVFDMNSRNGVRVDGVRCQEAWVFPESRLTISDQRFQLDYKPVGERPFPDAEDPSRRKSLMAKIGIKDDQLDAIVTRIKDQYGPDENENKRKNLTIDM